eukprot:2888726-Rhodomonas_salina.1
MAMEAKAGRMRSGTLRLKHFSAPEPCCELMPGDARFLSTFDSTLRTCTGYVPRYSLHSTDGEYTCTRDSVAAGLGGART